MRGIDMEHFESRDRPAAAGERAAGVSDRAEGPGDQLPRRAAQQPRKLDVVTRDEFDTQTRVLQRTREKLEQLEARLREMEAAARQRVRLWHAGGSPVSEPAPDKRRCPPRCSQGRPKDGFVSLARRRCRAQLGLEAPLVHVEVNLGDGLPCSRARGLARDRW